MPGADDINRRIAEAVFTPAHPTRRHGDTRNDTPRLIVIHATTGSEGLNKAVNTAHQFSGPAVEDDVGSTQFAVDAGVLIRCGKDEWPCKGAGGANHDGLHVEQCGKASQTEAEWLDEASRATIKNAALVVAFWHLKFGIPVDRFLTLEEVANPQARGLTDHNIVSLARKASTHSDPGKGYPHNVLLADIQEWLGHGAAALDDEEDDQMFVTSPHTPHLEGRTAGATLDRKGRQIILWNDARMKDDIAFSTVFVRKLEQAPGKPLAIGPRKAGDGVVVVYDDGVTQDYLWKV